MNFCQIRRRRKRWPPSELRPDESYLAPPDTISPNFPVDGFPPSRDGLTLSGLLTPEKLERTGEPGEKNSVLSEAYALPIPAPRATDGREGQSRAITVHQFLQDHMTRTPCRKYGRQNRFAAVELGVYGSEGSSASPISCDDDYRSDQEVSTPHQPQAHHVQLRDPPRRVPRRRQKLFAKPLAQRLLEADVLSTGTFSPTTAPDPAHTSTRRPLQFVTALNLTPSLETRIYQRRQVVAGGSSSTRTLAESDSPRATVAPSRAPDRDTLDTLGARIGGGSGTFLSSGKRALRTRGWKRGLARSSAGPFEFVPLPLVRVKTHRAAVQPRYPVLRSVPDLAHVQNNANNP